MKNNLISIQNINSYRTFKTTKDNYIDNNNNIINNIIINNKKNLTQTKKY